MGLSPNQRYPAFLALGWHVYSSRIKTPPAAFGGAEMCLRAEGLVGFRSSERRWSNISTRAINISLLRSENRAVEEIACRSVRRQTFRAVSPQSIFSQLLPRGGTDLTDTGSRDAHRRPHRTA